MENYKVWEFWEFLGIDQDLEVQASRNSVDTQKFSKFRSWERQNRVNIQKFKKFQKVFRTTRQPPRQAGYQPWGL